MSSTHAVPTPFVWRRLHSLMGLFLVLFLFEHLFVNSQAALFLGENGKGFVNLVNHIHDLPYLEVIEIFLLGVPFAVHMIWGVQYLLTSKFNSKKTDGSSPSLSYGRNRAYTWQRITSWILVIGIIGHVVKFRFIEYPISVNQGTTTFYCVKVGMDNGLYTVADRIGASIFDQKGIEKERIQFEKRKNEKALLDASQNIRNKRDDGTPYDPQKEVILSSAQNYKEKESWVAFLEKKSLRENEVIAVAQSFGTVSLLAVRDTFKNPVYVVLYTLFVLAACFHACNGFWTFLITWGVVLRMAAQKAMVKVSYALMALLIFLGLAAVWGTYWINLRY